MFLFALFFFNELTTPKGFLLERAADVPALPRVKCALINTALRPPATRSPGQRGSRRSILYGVSSQEYPLRYRKFSPLDCPHRSVWNNHSHHRHEERSRQLHRTRVVRAVLRAPFQPGSVRQMSAAGWGSCTAHPPPAGFGGSFNQNNPGLFSNCEY